MTFVPSPTDDLFLFNAQFLIDVWEEFQTVRFSGGMPPGEKRMGVRMTGELTPIDGEFPARDYVSQQVPPFTLVLEDGTKYQFTASGALGQYPYQIEIR